MSTTTTAPTLDELLAALAAAVAARDRARAIELETTIEQRLAASAIEHTATERRLRELMRALDAAPVVPTLSIEAFTLDRSAGEEEGVVYPVWFGTNRKPDGPGFSGERHDTVSRGRADVRIPKAHRFGETGSSFWTRLRRFDLSDDHLRVDAIATLTAEACFAEIKAAMQAAAQAGDEPQALFFLHGFNVGFEDAAIRAAQIGYDLKVPGATAFFSWPSRGSVVSYPADEASIEASEAAITDFLVEFCDKCGAKKVHVVAHSMGNRGLLRALQRIAADAARASRVQFGQIFLAAPDVDRDLFLDLARLLPSRAERTTLYASKGDMAVHLSAKLHEAPRAGYFEPYTVVPNIDTIAVPYFDVDLLGHGYFAAADALLHDIFDLIRSNQPPGKRQRVQPLQADGVTLWQVVR
jgi:esterase/lipase superfamily enzyme